MFEVGFAPRKRTRTRCEAEGWKFDVASIPTVDFGLKASTISAGVKKKVESEERARKRTEGSVCPRLASKDRGNLPEPGVCEGKTAVLSPSCGSLPDGSDHTNWSTSVMSAADNIRDRRISKWCAYTDTDGLQSITIRIERIVADNWR